MNNLISSMELSPSGIKLVLGYVFQNKVYVLDALVSDPIEIDSNGYLNKKQVQDSIQVLISTAERNVKETIGNFVVLLPPDEFVAKEGKNSNYIVGDVVTKKDYANCVNMISKQAKEENLSVVYVDPISFISDSTGQTKDFPIGKKTENFSVYADAHLISKVTLDYYSQMLSEIGINPYLKLVSPFACASFLNFFKAPLSFFSLQVERNYTYFSFSKDKRFCSSKQILFGVEDIYKFASDKLSLPFERVKELATTFGLDNEEGYPFFIQEKMSLKDVVLSLKDGASFLSDLRKEMDSIDPSLTIPIILLGEIDQIDGFYKYLSKVFQREILSFSPKVIGARNSSFLPCLGGIRITANSYMSPLSNNRIREQNNLFSRSSFNRG